MEDIQTENRTTESRDGKKSSVSSDIGLISNEIKKAKTTVKKKRARILEIVDSSDEEDHLPVNVDLSFTVLTFFLISNIFIFLVIIQRNAIIDFTKLEKS